MSELQRIASPKPKKKGITFALPDNESDNNNNSQDKQISFAIPGEQDISNQNLLQPNQNNTEDRRGCKYYY